LNFWDQRFRHPIHRPLALSLVPGVWTGHRGLLCHQT
jgi:hypothetical protein